MENEKAKPFDMVSIVFLIMIAALSDASDIVTDIVFAVPVVGQIAYFANAFLVSPIVWAVIQGWFIMKLGLFGKVGIVNLAGGIANVVGIPGTTITTGVAIWLANHPKLTAVATTIATTVAAGATTGGVGAIAGVRGAAATAEKVAIAGEKAATSTAQAGRAASTIGKTVDSGQVVNAEKVAPTGKEATDKTLGEKPTPFEELQRLTEEPLPEEEGGEEEEYS